MRNIIINGDSLKVLSKFKKECIDVILTSPFYNTSRKGNNKRDTFQTRYDVFNDVMTDEEYINFLLNIFVEYDKVLKNNGVVIFNLSYSTDKPHLMNEVIYNINKYSNFSLVDTVVWKKDSALPNNTSKNRLTRIVEFVYIFCKKGMEKDFYCNKGISSENSKGQKYYNNHFNFINAKNNNGSNKLNKATFSTELCEPLLKLYTPENGVVLDSFNGTGTTGVAAIINGFKYIGIELSKSQCEFSVERIKEQTNEKIELIECDEK